jgi:hypothetical protein
MRQKDIGESLNLSKNFEQIPSSILKPDRQPDDFIILSYSRYLKKDRFCGRDNRRKPEGSGGRSRRNRSSKGFPEKDISE